MAVGLLLGGLIALIGLSYMGTPMDPKIETPIATRIIQDLAQEEGLGGSAGYPLPAATIRCV